MGHELALPGDVQAAVLLAVKCIEGVEKESAEQEAEDMRKWEMGHAAGDEKDDNYEKNREQHETKDVEKDVEKDKKKKEARNTADKSKGVSEGRYRKSKRDCVIS